MNILNHLILSIFLALYPAQVMQQGITNIPKQAGVSGHSYGRSFNGTNQALNSSTTINFSSTTVMSVWFWLNETAFNNSDELLAESSTNYNSNVGAFLIDPNSGTTHEFDFNVNGIGSVACNIVRPSASAWHSYLLEVDMTAGTCKAYVDGSSVTVTGGGPAVSGTISTQTVYLMSRAASSLWNAGSLSEFAVWKVDESSHASALNGGTLPSAVDSGNLVSYVHLCGTASPEPDIVGGWNWCVTGTPAQVTGPGVINCP